MRRYPIVPVAGVLTAVAVLAGCSSSVSGRPTGGPSPAGSSPASSAANGSSAAGSFPSSSGSQTGAGSVPSTGGASGSSAAGASPAAVLQSIALKSSDLTSGYTMSLVDGGDQVTGQVTLDNCGYDFTTEAHRQVRRQYSVDDPSGDPTGASNEVVAYDSAAEAAKAISQWHASAAHCPHTPVKSKVAGVPDLLTTVSRNSVGVAGLPVSDNVLTVESGTGDGQTLYNVTIIQVRGRYLDAVYVTQDTAPTSADIDDTTELAGITGRRLAAVR